MEALEGTGYFFAQDLDLRIETLAKIVKVVRRASQ